MPRRRSLDLTAVDDLLRLRERVVTHSELLELGMAMSTICSRIRRTGAWQRMHPGVVLTHSGTPTRRERLLSALAYAGKQGVLTGVCALRLYGIKAVRDYDGLHVLVPHAQHRQTRDGVLVVRTRRMPESRERSGLPVADPARCVVDACRELTRVGDVRELVAEAVQTGLCTVEQLREAVFAAARQRTALSREVLVEVHAGVRSAAEARVREVFQRRGVPQPCWNWSLHRLDGSHLVTPDGWWQKIGAALQIDSLAWHLSPALYRRTQQLQRVLSTYDVPFLPVAPTDVFSDEDAFVAQVLQFLRRHANHEPNPELVARPPAGARRPG